MNEKLREQLEMWEHLNSDAHHGGCGHGSCPCPADKYEGDHWLIFELRHALARLTTLRKAEEGPEEDGFRA